MERGGKGKGANQSYAFFFPNLGMYCCWSTLH